jgi:hypothetical protein
MLSMVVERIKVSNISKMILAEKTEVLGEKPSQLTVSTTNPTGIGRDLNWSSAVKHWILTARAMAWNELSLLE